MASAAPTAARVFAATRWPSKRRRAVIGLTAMFWIGAFILLSVRGAFTERLAFAEIAPRRALVALFGALLCIAVSRIIDRLRFRSFAWRVVAAILLAFVAAVLITAFHHLSYRYVDPLPGAQKVSVFEAAWWVTVWLGYSIAWTGTYIALIYHWQVQEQERHLAAMRELTQEARLAALRAQINPHFLFNTLNSISASVLERDIAAAERMLQNLATFFRATLSSQAVETVELADEIALQQLYLEIEAARFADRMSVDIDVPPELARACVPTLILQPLVENAVRHGVGRSARMTRIRIAACARETRLALTVENDVVPGEAAGGTGLGLKNVAARLHAHFRDEAELSAGPVPGGFRVRLGLPLRFAA